MSFWNRDVEKFKQRYHCLIFNFNFLLEQDHDDLIDVVDCLIDY